MNFILLIMTLLQMQSTANEISPELLTFKENKQIPKLIEKNVLTALSHYAELKHTPIKFVFKKQINGSVMQAQPLLSSVFKGRKHRAYQINISALLKLVHSAVPIHQLPDNIMIGWIGHELGHIMDYEQKSNPGLLKFGLCYLFSKTYRKQSEVNADTYAVINGLGQNIIDTKKFILDHAELPQSYKDKIARLYLSPDAIVEQVRNLEEKKLHEQKKALGQ